MEKAKEKKPCWPYVLAILVCGAVGFGGSVGLMAAGLLSEALIEAAMIDLFYLLPSAVVLVSCIGTWKLSRFVWQAPVALGVLCGAIFVPYLLEMPHFTFDAVFAWARIVLTPALICILTQLLMLLSLRMISSPKSGRWCAALAAGYYGASAWTLVAALLGQTVQDDRLLTLLGLAVLALIWTLAAARLFLKEGKVFWILALWPLAGCLAQSLASAIMISELLVDQYVMSALAVAGAVLLGGAFASGVLRSKKS